MRKSFFYASLFCTFINFHAGVIAQKPCSISAVCDLPSLPNRPAGRFEVFVAKPGSAGGIYHTWQRIEGGWQNPYMVYKPAPDNIPNGMVSGRDGDGRVIVAWIVSGNIFVAAARSMGTSLTTYTAPTFGPLTAPDGTPSRFTYLTIANNANGLIEIIALDQKGRAWSFREIKQTPPTPLSWQWKTAFIGGGALKNISVCNFDTDGKLALVATGGNGVVYMTKQVAAGGIWDPNPTWANLDGNNIAEVHAHQSSQHQLEIIALGADGSLYLRFQNVNNGPWSNWYTLISNQLVGRFAPSIFFNHLKDGSLFLLSHMKDSQWGGTFGKSSQLPNNGGWPAKFTFLHYPGNITDALAYVDRNLFAIAPDANGVFHYFGCFKLDPRTIEHYIDDGIIDSQGRGFVHFENRDHEMPNLPWK